MFIINFFDNKFNVLNIELFRILYRFKGFLFWYFFCLYIFGFLIGIF